LESKLKLAMAPGSGMAACLGSTVKTALLELLELELPPTAPGAGAGVLELLLLELDGGGMLSGAEPRPGFLPPPPPP
jgi:hypothetical protein